MLFITGPPVRYVHDDMDMDCVGAKEIVIQIELYNVKETSP